MKNKRIKVKNEIKREVFKMQKVSNFYNTQTDNNEEKGRSLITNTRKDIIKKLKQSEKEIENGEGIDSDMAFKELRLKYGYKSI